MHSIEIGLERHVEVMSALLFSMKEEFASLKQHDIHYFVIVQLKRELSYFSHHSQTQIPNLKVRLERVRAAKMDSRKRKAPHKNSGISGRRKIQRFDSFMFCFWLRYDNRKLEFKCLVSVDDFF